MTDKPYETDVAFIRSLAAILSEHDLTDLRVKREYGEDDTLDVRVSRGPLAADPAPAPAYAPAPPQAPAQTPSAHETPRVQGSGDPAAHPGAVTSPMVGTVYLSAEPGSAPFVAVGDRVSEGQTLLIVEAMKTMNHIPAPRAGIVRRIVIEDGAPVEFGAPLLIVE